MTDAPVRGPLPVTFYLPNLDEVGDPDALDPFDAWKAMPRGEGFWILQSWRLLRHFGADVAIRATLPDEGIVVFHRRSRHALFRESSRKLAKLILVACRGDLHDTVVGDFELLQNRFFADDERRFMMPHWPMPHIRPRDPARGDRLRSIGFKGFAKQIHPDFLSTDWTGFLQELGVDWVPDAVPFSDAGASQFDERQWSDYTELDAIVAVRPERTRLQTHKPALKLYNAWHASVVPLLGPEIAYREIGEPGGDYLEVENLDQAKLAVKRLVEKPELFRALIANGRKKAPLYTHEAVARCWQQFLFQTVPEKWGARRQNPLSRAWRRTPIGVRYHLGMALKQVTLQRTR